MFFLPFFAVIFYCPYSCGENLFLDHRAISPMILTMSTMLSAAIKSQYSSMLPLLCHCLPVFDKICELAMNFVFSLSA